MSGRFKAGLIALSLFSVSSAHAASLTGTVTELGTAKPLVGAQVSLSELRGSETSEILYQEITGANGAFSMTGVKPGRYAVITRYPGMKPGSVSNFTIEDTQTNVIDITLARDRVVGSR